MPLLTLADGASLHYEIHGDGPPLLLVSGLGGVARFWSPHVEAFTSRFRVILHDHRGTGSSSASMIDYSVPQMTEDLVQLMDHLAIEKAHLVGHSTGGAIGQSLALDLPERLDRLVLSATWSGADDYFRRLFDVRSEVLRAGGIEAYVRSNAIFMFPPGMIRDRLSRMLDDEEEAVRSFPSPKIMLSRIKAIQKFDRRDELGQIAAPTLVIGARDDIVTPAYFSEELGRLIPGAKTIILPDGGHFFPLVHPDSFCGHVLEFLADRESSQS